MAKVGFSSGNKPGRPQKGMNGPNDKGGGTKTYCPPMPKGGPGHHPLTKCKK